MLLEFTGEILIWRGPAPHFFVRVPDDASARLDAVRSGVTYGWGMIPVQVRVGRTQWATSLFPKDGGYLVPLRASARRAEALDAGEPVHVTLIVDT